uniref:Uncharacterized protein n=1 Tax=Arundo donax TaxID=35708 RepID=A0A0A9HT08_ARUDO
MHEIPSLSPSKVIRSGHQHTRMKNEYNTTLLVHSSGRADLTISASCEDVERISAGSAITKSNAASDICHN